MRSARLFRALGAGAGRWLSLVLRFLAAGSCLRLCSFLCLLAVSFGEKGAGVVLPFLKTASPGKDQSKGKTHAFQRPGLKVGPGPPASLVSAARGRSGRVGPRPAARDKSGGTAGRGRRGGSLAGPASIFAPGRPGPPWPGFVA
ncbi:MAG: hypothetical protein NTY36_03375 [Deltaproteobacteria bacterium]|nr:hypothetical protein [Deltaproteobacteria bacterium]